MSTRGPLIPQSKAQHWAEVLCVTAEVIYGTPWSWSYNEIGELQVHPDLFALEV